MNDSLSHTLESEPDKPIALSAAFRNHSHDANAMTAMAFGCDTCSFL